MPKIKTPLKASCRCVNFDELSDLVAKKNTFIRIIKFAQ